MNATVHPQHGLSMTVNIYRPLKCCRFFRVSQSPPIGFLSFVLILKKMVWMFKICCGLTMFDNQPLIFSGVARWHLHGGQLLDGHQAAIHDQTMHRVRLR